MDMELKELSLDEVVEQLTKLKAMHKKADFWKLRIALSDGRKSGYGSHDVEMLESAVRLLPYVQTVGARGLDWSRLMPPAVFSRRAAMFDLNYFKYMFLRTSDIPFDEDRLEDDMQQLAADLVEMAEGHATFLYRDYQARNLMVRSDGSLALIDFQGGKQGPVYYDVASFLMQASAHYGATLRQRLAACYLDELRGLVGWAPSPREFEERLRTFMFFRTLQVLGAYGFRGLFEKKPHFIESIPFALANLKDLLKKNHYEEYPYLVQILNQLTELPQFQKKASPDNKSLIVKVFSFSYKKGIPTDDSGNGGGYVFDCRALPNPGREPEFKTKTGRDWEVADYLNAKPQTHIFLDHVKGIVAQSVENYCERHFSNLMISFGCTGGQHRSVFFAQSIYDWLKNEYPYIHLKLNHIEQKIEEESGL